MVRVVRRVLDGLVLLVLVTRGGDKVGMLHGGSSIWGMWCIWGSSGGGFTTTRWTRGVQNTNPDEMERNEQKKRREEKIPAIPVKQGGCGERGRPGLNTAGTVAAIEPLSMTRIEEGKEKDKDKEKKRKRRRRKRERERERERELERV